MFRIQKWHLFCYDCLVRNISVLVNLKRTVAFVCVFSSVQHPGKYIILAVHKFWVSVIKELLTGYCAGIKQTGNKKLKKKWNLMNQKHDPIHWKKKLWNNMACSSELNIKFWSKKTEILFFFVKHSNNKL